MFRPEDNLESPYARAALAELYSASSKDRWSFRVLEAFENATGLRHANR